MYVSREIHVLADFIREECVKAWLDAKLLVKKRNVRNALKLNPDTQAAVKHELCCQITFTA